ncbi:tyrosine-protein kinase domain-containing protein [Rhizobium binxianense]|uniref:tyrosine-protein kinase domain-containing protein n=1 Tax=Rhizobium binxianense TaxID=3024242 RepID=UPI00236023A3|nr:tyrosine-protein kinase domain-containing protein [Rhizobium sp. MC62]MDC9811010.1 GNVR domain-containing protein [Rhizobium sp. MC62]
MTSSTIFSGVSPLSLPAATTGGNSPLTLRDMLFFLRMRWLWIVATTIAFVAVAGSYLLTADPTFVASTQLVIFPQVSGSEAQRAFAEDAFIEGQLEIARSSDVVGGTVRALSLDADPDFVDQTPSLQDRAKNWLMGISSEPDVSQETAAAATHERRPQTEQERIYDRAIATLANMVGIRRIGSSTIIEISAAASTPQKAVDIADTLAKQYIQKNISMKANASRQYSEWLEKFVSEQQRGLAEAASALASFTSNPRDQFKLAELQSATDARRTLYENTLNQLTEARQRITYPVSDATIVSRATLPLSKARPRSALVLAFAAAVGLGAGLALAMIRHAGDRRIVRPHQIAEAAGLSSVTLLETSKLTRNGHSRRFIAAGTGSSTAAAYPVIPGMAELSATVVGLRRKRRVVVGIVAVNPGGGASTIACELAVLSSISGAQTLLIDAAAQKSSLSKSIAPHSSTGLVDILDNGELIQAAALPLTPTLKFLPLGKVEAVTPAIRLSSRRTQLSFADLKKEFDAIFVDISAFSASPDANAIAPELDGVLVVTSHGRTSIDDTMRVIDTLRNVGAEILGVIINHAPKRMQS